jgi:Fe-S-cluster containining protein
MSEWQCLRCGRCCQTAFIALHRSIDDKDETGRWLALHRCDVMAYPGQEGSVLGVSIPLVCQWLGYNKKTNEYFCKHYDKRPYVCSVYECNRNESDKVRVDTDGVHVSE